MPHSVIFSASLSQNLYPHFCPIPSHGHMVAMRTAHHVLLAQVTYVLFEDDLAHHRSRFGLFVFVRCVSVVAMHIVMKVLEAFAGVFARRHQHSRRLLQQPEQGPRQISIGSYSEWATEWAARQRLTTK